MARTTQELGPYVELTRDAWADLAETTALPLDAATLDKLRGLSDPTSLTDVREVYQPLSALLTRYVRHTGRLHRSTNDFLGVSTTRTPFVIGIAGSVAVGKSTTARLLRELLASWPEHPRVELVTTDGFLWPNAELARRGLMARKGFPESYDRRTLLNFVVDVKSGIEEVSAPVYSHLVYDIVPEVSVSVQRPDILIVEGLNVLQPARTRADSTARPDAPARPDSTARPDAATGSGAGLAVSDFFDFTVYVDADTADIRRWYVQRFMSLRETAFRDPRSYFRRYAEMNDEQATAQAEQLWDAINGPNLEQNIAPTRERATAILRKGSDHRVDWVRIRKI